MSLAAKLRSTLRAAITDLRSDSMMRSLARNIGMMFSANLIAPILGLFSLAFTAQALGPAGLGVLALIEAYARTVDRLIRLEPAQALIRYGSAALESGREDAFRRIVKAATLLDVCGAALAGCMALLLLGLASAWVGFDEEQQWLAGCYALVIFLHLSSTPFALLRLLGRFDLDAKLLVILATLRLIMTASLWALEADLTAFVMLMIAFTVAEQMLPFALAWTILRKRMPGPYMSVSLKGFWAENPSIARFVFNANVNEISRNATRQFDVMIISGLVSTADVGLYQVAKRTGLAAMRLQRPVQLVIYPLFCQLWEQGRKRTMLWLLLGFGGLMAAAGLFGLMIVWLYGDALIRAAFGAEFEAALPLLLVHVGAVIVFLVGAALNSALLSVGADRELVTISLVGSVLFFISLGPAVQAYGVIAANTLHLLFNVIWLAGCIWAFARAYRRGITLGAVTGAPKSDT